MLAELRRGRADRAGRGGELGHDARHLELRAVAGDDILDHAARDVVRIGRDVGRAVDAARRDCGLFHLAQHFLLRALCGPGADGVVDALHLRGAAVVTRERRIIAQVGTADHGHEPVEETVGVAGDENVRAVLAGIQVGGRDAGKRASERSRT